CGDGDVWYEGRCDDLIVSSSFTSGAFEVDDVLVKHPAVAECAVVGSPDEDRGQVVKAFIVLKNEDEHNHDALVKEQQDYSKQHTAPYKYPRRVEFIAAIPKTTSGKRRHIQLREF